MSESLTTCITKALRNLGGTAPLFDIYAEVKRLGYESRSDDLNKLIRKRIFEHSSDTKSFLEEDLFRSVKGIGGGFWELRNFATEPLDLEKRSAGRTDVIISRLVRDGILVRELKALHENRCQICGETINFPNGECYSEGHHIRPLGQPHGGPDVRSNILIVCPNDHARCDLGAIRLDLQSIRLHKDHKIDAEFVDYHNANIWSGSSQKTR